jgi:hypothetical protein
VARDRWEVDRELEDLLEVISTRNALLLECFLDSGTIEGDDVDDVREAGGQTHELEHVADLCGRQSINVVEHYDDRPLESCERCLEPSSSRPHSLLSALKKLAQQLAGEAAALNPWTDERKPRESRECLPIVL